MPIYYVLISLFVGEGASDQCCRPNLPEVLTSKYHHTLLNDIRECFFAKCLSNMLKCWEDNQTVKWIWNVCLIVRKFLYHIQKINYLWQFRCLEFRHLPRTLISRLKWATNFSIARSCRFGDHCVINVRQLVCAPVPIHVVGCASEEDVWTLDIETVAGNFFFGCDIRTF